MNVLRATVQMAHLSLSTFSFDHQFLFHGLEQDGVQVDMMSKKPKLSLQQESFGRSAWNRTQNVHLSLRM